LTQNNPTRAAEHRRRRFHPCVADADFPGRRAAADPKPPARRRRLSDAGAGLYAQRPAEETCLLSL